MWITAMGCKEAQSALNLRSSACLAAYPGMVEAFLRIVLRYIVVTTASTTKWQPSAKKSRTTSRDASAALKPLAYLTTAMFGIHTSLKIETSTPTRPTCIKWRIPPLGHRTTYLSKDSLEPVASPH